MTYELPSRLLRVDLTAERVGSEPIPDAWLRRFVGGKGLGARYLYEELPAGADPLGADNALLFVLGPLSGLLPGDARYAVVTKSPLTGAFLDSYGGGSFPAALVGALDGHAGVLVTGTADRPVRLDIAEGSATVEPADELWGADTRETDEAFDASVACVGPAGERRVRFATIASDAGEHQAGRGGAGAVMGAKRLKAVVARGDPPSTDALSDLRERYAERFAEDERNRWYRSSETLETVDFANEVGALATRGWRERRFEGVDDIGIEAVQRAATERERDGEAIPGGFRVETDEGDSVPRGAAPMSLGAGLGIDDFDAVALLGERCDRLGMDVIGAGSAVAWAIRALTEGDLDLDSDLVPDRDLDFGRPDAARRLLDEIAARETPLGDALAEGVARAANRFGGEEFVPTVKGMSMPAYDPRGAGSMALAYATSDRGACHRRSLPVETEVVASESWGPADAARLVAREQDTQSLLWSLIADDFAGQALRTTLGAEWLAAVGLDYDFEELRTVGERIWTLTRLFNVREGFSRDDDELPGVLTAAEGDGDGDGLDEASFRAMLDAYYDHRGWDAEGVPARATLERLDLASTADEETPTGAERSTRSTGR